MIVSLSLSFLANGINQLCVPFMSKKMLTFNPACFTESNFSAVEIEMLYFSKGFDGIGGIAIGLKTYRLSVDAPSNTK